MCVEDRVSSTCDILVGEPASGKPQCDGSELQTIRFAAPRVIEDAQPAGLGVKRLWLRPKAASFNAQPEAPACTDPATKKAGAFGWALNEKMCHSSPVAHALVASSTVPDT